MLSQEIFFEGGVIKNSGDTQVWDFLLLTAYSPCRSALVAALRACCITPLFPGSVRQNSSLLIPFQLTALRD